MTHRYQNMWQIFLYEKSVQSLLYQPVYWFTDRLLLQPHRLGSQCSVCLLPLSDVVNLMCPVHQSWSISPSLLSLTLTCLSCSGHTKMTSHTSNPPQTSYKEYKHLPVKFVESVYYMLHTCLSYISLSSVMYVCVNEAFIVMLICLLCWEKKKICVMKLYLCQRLVWHHAELRLICFPVFIISFALHKRGVIPLEGSRTNDPCS